MRKLTPRRAVLLTAAVLVPFALLAGYALVRWQVWSWSPWCGSPVAESPHLQKTLHPLVLRFGLIAGACVWVAALGILYGIRHRGDGLLFVSGVNFLWPALAFCGCVLSFIGLVLGVAGGLYVTVHGIVQRRFLAPLLSLAANLAAIPFLCWFLWEGMVFCDD